MPNYYTPGVYIEEPNKGPRPIEAVSTAVAAFVGFAPYSTVKDANRPVLITSWTQFVEKFGKRDKDSNQKSPYMKNAYLAHAVYGFFLNGGTRCWVIRAMPAKWEEGLEAAPSEISTAKGRALKNKERLLTIKSKAPIPDEDIEISLTRAPATRPDDYQISIAVKMGDKSEEFKHVALKPPAPQPTPPPSAPDPADPNAPAPQPAPASRRGTAAAAATAPVPPDSNGNRPLTLNEVNQKSQFITIELDEKASSLEPAFGDYYIAVPQPDPENPKHKQLNGIQPPDIVGDPLKHTGIVGLEIAEDVTMICCPDLMSPLAYPNGEIISEKVQSVQQAMMNHCELAGGRMAILDVPPTIGEPQDVERWLLSDVRYDSMFAALYYPWLTIANPLASDSEPQTISVPPCGHIAGIYARNDTERGVHKAPANEIVRGALKLSWDVTGGEQEGLNRNGINCIRSFSGRGIRVWGARTISSDPAWRYINVRRLFNMVEKSIERDTQWVVFEPNDPDLWSRVRRDVGAFLTTLWRDGMLFGDTPQQAFFVKCDEELNPPESRDLGRLIIEVGLAPVKPAEFVVFRFSQYTGGGA